MAFHQEGPQLRNTWQEDRALREHLGRLVPRDILDDLTPALTETGELAATELAELAEQAESEPPRLISFDAWGRRIDHIAVGDAWEALHAHSVQLGLCAIPYEDRYGPFRRVIQQAFVHLYAPSSAIYSCPVAMTDAAARVLTDHAPQEVRDRVVPRLTSRDVDLAWTSGQWMTELAGGSDVGGTETAASTDQDGRWRLHGLKWFTSATTADCALTLARPPDAPAGSKGLGLFLVERTDPFDQTPQVGRTIGVRRLKDKLGTRALPTAELTLDGATAIPITLTDGLRTISGMLNITRLHNAWNAAAGMRRAVALAHDYARRRQAFGAPLRDLPLHRRTLAELAVEAEAATAMTLDLSVVTGRVEAGQASQDDRWFVRLLTPVAKLLTGKDAVAVASEALECFGGAGYIEDTGLPRLLRDAQVLPIWEGTTNVLALDVLRVIAREPDALASVLEGFQSRLHHAGANTEVGPVWQLAATACDELGAQAARWPSDAREDVELQMREFALRLGRTWASTTLWEHAAYMVSTHGTGSPEGDRAITVAQRYTTRWLSHQPPTEHPSHETSLSVLE